MTKSEIIISVDQSEPVTFDEFVRIISEEDVEPLSETELNEVKKLLVNESIFLGMEVEVKRVIKKIVPNKTRLKDLQ